MRARTSQWRPLFLLAWSVWLVDFLTKIWAEQSLNEPINLIGSFFKLQLIKNTGAAFSLQFSSIFLTAFAAATVIAIFYWAPKITSRAWAITLALVLGGALGNLTDRIFKGAVTDWISVKFWPTFNIADSAIVIAAAIAILLSAKNIAPISKSQS